MLYTLEYKRNQIFEAFATLSGRTDRILSGQVRRLLDTDRKLATVRRSKHPEERNHAFYGAPPAGSGNEVWYGAYDVFALYLAWKLMQWGWPQGTVVRTMRKLRTSLMHAHREIMQMDASMFSEEQIARSAKPGAIAYASQTPVFLIFSRPENTPQMPEHLENAHVQFGDEQYFLDVRKGRYRGEMATFVELSGMATALHQALAATSPLKRGRPSS